MSSIENCSVFFKVDISERLVIINRYRDFKIKSPHKMFLLQLTTDSIDFFDSALKTLAFNQILWYLHITGARVSEFSSARSL